MALPNMLQYEGNKPDTQRCANFLTALRNEDVFSVEVADFKIKSEKRSKTLSRKFDFRSRCYNVKAGNYSKAMQLLLKVDAKVNLNTIEQTMKESLPKRSYDELTDGQRQSLCAYVNSLNDDQLITAHDVLLQL